MVGPTGCGKTEISRRLATLCNAPFVKVEATKYTEVGFHGKDVDSIITDLLDNGINLLKKLKEKEMKKKIDEQVENKILDSLIGIEHDKKDREVFRKLLREGTLDDRQITIDVVEKDFPSFTNVSLDAGSGIILGEILGKAINQNKTVTKTLSVKDARPYLFDSLFSQFVNDKSAISDAIKAVEEKGIVVIDEIDKVISGDKDKSADASAEGVQRDLLPLVEGTTITTKYGPIHTDHILFIASGAFHTTKVSNLLPELQGRFPIRVDLQPLTEENYYQILTEPKYNLLEQQEALLSTEGVTLEYTKDAIKKIAQLSFQMNATVENIGARRLHTIIEKLMDEISFDAPDYKGKKYIVDEKMVEEKLKDMIDPDDPKKYIL